MTPTEVKAAEAASKSVTLTFTTDAELEVYVQLTKDAEADERSLSKFIVRKLKTMGE